MWSKDFEKANKPSRRRFQNPCAEIPLPETRWSVRTLEGSRNFETFSLMACWFRTVLNYELEYPPPEEVIGIRIIRRV